MKIFPDYCIIDCKLRKQANTKDCPAGYLNPAKTLEGALHQAERKGEWPCSFSPHRGTFVAAKSNIRAMILL
jgi:hypothetical protein